MSRQHRTRNMKGATAMANHGQSLPVWMIWIASLDPLGTWQKSRRQEARALIGTGYASKQKLFEIFLAPNIRCGNEK